MNDSFTKCLAFGPLLGTTYSTNDMFLFIHRHTYFVSQTFLLSIMKMGNPKLLRDLEKKEGENIKSNPSL
jgi:hypothetical protein